MKKLLQQLRSDLPELHFTAGKTFHWAPATQEIFYVDEDTPSASWSLLHEIGHALLGHNSYSHDFELLEIEVAAWQKAQQLGEKYHITIAKDHIEDCLDSYRDWLHRRSVCPICEVQTLQLDGDTKYRCFNCRAVWQVATSRFCRPYRKFTPIEKSPAI